jgi:hypothetical protein
LGRDLLVFSTGFGQAAPATVYLGGEAESAITHITWSSWGGAQAIGQGTGYHYGSAGAADGRFERETLVAFGLGICDGTYMYQRLDEYFPTESQIFDPHRAMNVCTFR